MTLPTIEECLEYFDQFAMLPNIRAHSMMVARVAATLCDALAAEPKPVTTPSKEEVITGALLHDIAKTPCLASKESHASYGQKICLKLGYPQLGEVVAEHVALKEFAEERYAQGIFSSKELVYYADKRVCHDQIATLGQRRDYIVARYAAGDASCEKQIDANFTFARRLENYLFAWIAFLPEQLAVQLVAIPQLQINTNHHDNTIRREAHYYH